MKITLILFVIVASLLYNFALKKDTKTENKNQIEEIDSSKIVALKKDIETTMLELLSTLKGIKDLSSAKNALPTLSKIDNNLKKYEPMIYKASTMDRIHIKKYVSDFVPHLKEPLNNIRDIAGASKIIDQSLKNLEETLLLYKAF